MQSLLDMARERPVSIANGTSSSAAKASLSAMVQLALMWLTATLVMANEAPQATTNEASINHSAAECFFIACVKCSMVSAASMRCVETQQNAVPLRPQSRSITIKPNSRLLSDTSRG